VSIFGQDVRPPVPVAGSGGDAVAAGAPGAIAGLGEGHRSDGADGVSLRSTIVASKRKQHFGSYLQHITPVDRFLLTIGPRHESQLRRVRKV
jgi:hypothetical protein